MVSKRAGICIKMFDTNQKQTNIGNGKQAGRDLIDYSTTIVMEAAKHASNIEKILQGVSKFTSDVKYEKPDTADYTVEDKIDHNNLEKYKEFFDDYMDNYYIVKGKIGLFEEQDSIFDKKLISHIKNKYIKHYHKDIIPDEIVNRIVLDIETELKNHSSLDLEDISGIHYVVFYVFAECKIFEKPPKAK